MSRVRARFLRDDMTVWRHAGYDANNPYGGSWQAPQVIKCRFMSSGDLQRDQEGGEFQPLSTYYIQSSIVKRGDRVLLGRNTDIQPPTEAETVRKIATCTPLRGSQDFTVYTG
jgi:hypothetical protein